MKFYVGSALLDTPEISEIAKAADDLGYDGIAIADHIVNRCISGRGPGGTRRRRRMVCQGIRADGAAFRPPGQAGVDARFSMPA
jgi:alkanesulfonate monooxygenase SsuD/methylene tetrahydromethanopterin reductase-like flavin-dependent oxidoreductase (luciferase family)